MDTLWNAKPFLRLLIGLVVGILLAQFIDIPIWGFTTVTISAALLLFIWRASVIPVRRFTFDWLEGLVFFLLIISVGYGRAYIHQDLIKESHFSHHLATYDSFVFELLQPAEPKARSTQLIGKVLAVNDSLKSRETTGKLLIYLKPDSSSALPKFGDQLLIKSKITALKAPTNPAQFDYSAYQANENIYHSAFVKSDQWTILKPNESISFWRTIYIARDYLLSTIDTYVKPENEKAVASALLLGYRELLPKEIKDVYAHTGSMHVLAVSGLHVGIVVMLLNHLLRFLKRTSRGRKLHFVLIVSFVWLFALLTGFKPSVARAAVMFTFLQIGISQKRSIDIVHITFVSAFTLLIINPNNLFRAGFQLSYGALLGILFLQRRIYELFFIYNRPLSKAWKLTSVGIAAQIGTLPLSLYYFGFFPLVFFLSNLLIILGATAVLGIGIVLFVVSPFEELATVVGTALEWVVWFINRYLQILSNIPNMVIEDIQINGWQVFLLYLLICSVTFSIVMRKKAVLKFAMIVLIGFSALTSFISIDKNDHRSFVVYDTANNFCLGLHNGEQSVIIHDFDSIEENRTFSFNVKPHLAKLGTQSVEYLSLNEIGTMEHSFAGTKIQNGFVQFTDQRLFIPTRKFLADSLGQVLSVDYIIIPQQQKKNYADLETIVAGNETIFVGEYRKRKHIHQAEIETGAGAHYTRSDGAFVVEFD